MTATAATILAQITTGTIATIGANGKAPIVHGTESVTLHIGGNVRRKVVVALNAATDTYAVTAYRLRGAQIATRSEARDIHAADLRSAVLTAAEAA